MVLAYYKFNNSKETKKLVAAILADVNFNCQDYKEILS